MEMTPDILKKICKENNLYITPCINDKIYLHYKGFNRIQCLEEYINLKTIYLEGNGLTTIEGLTKNKLLTTLFLQENSIEKIENLDSQADLHTLNLSRNIISAIANLSHMKSLVTLVLANNLLSTVTDIEHLLLVPSVVTLDIQFNKLDDEKVIDIISQMPNLRVLYLQGNPVISKIPHYRKTMLSRCKQLLYLDDKPVYGDERRRVDAWSQVLQDNGNYSDARVAEQAELALMKQEALSLDAKNISLFAKIVMEGQSNRLENQQIDTNRSSDTNSTASDTSDTLHGGGEKIQDPLTDSRKFVGLLDDTIRDADSKISMELKFPDQPRTEMDLMTMD